MAKPNDLTEKIFGKLTALKRVGSDRWDRATWLCRCECARTTVVYAGNLMSRHTRSCGCTQNKIPKEQSASPKGMPWAGSEVGYRQAHRWIRQNKPKPSACEMCREQPPTELSFDHKNGEWTRNIEDYQWLCTSCHKLKDAGRGARSLTKARCHRIREFYATGTDTLQGLADLFKVNKSTIKKIVYQNEGY